MSKSLPRFGRFSATFSLSKLSTLFSLSSSSGTPKMYTLFLLLVPHSQVGFLHSFCLFNFCSSDWIISIDLYSSSLILSSAWSSLLLKLSIQFFSSAVLFFSSKIFVWFLFMFSISLLSFSFYSHIVFLISLDGLFLFSCSSLGICRTILLSSLLSHSWTISWGQIQEACSIPLLASFFPDSL